MSEVPPSGLPSDPKAAIEMLQAELAETNREVMMLTLEMQERAQALAESEERYRLAAERLKVEARRKDEFLALLGHELRNPLAPILTAVHLLRASADADSVARINDMIERQVSHLARIIDDLLDVSRIARGKVSLRREPLDLAALVRTTCEDHRAEIEGAGLSLAVDLSERAVPVSGDPTRLSQVMSNLITNARKFTDAGGAIEVRLSVEGSTAVVVVSDNGMGIGPDMLARLFEPFSQSERVRVRRTGGLGLGLALVKGLMELHEGSVRAESPGIGKGATFTLTLPLAPLDVALERAGETPPARKWRILVVEDNSDAAITLVMLLESAGHTVVQTADARTALQKAREFRPEVILSDIGLPGDMDGYDLARTIRADQSFGNPRLIAITGFGQASDRQRALEAGFSIHLTKPVAPETLERVLSGA